MGAITIFIWNDSFTLGFEELDNQHKHLFEIGTRLHELIERVDFDDLYDEIVEAVEELDSYTRYHFESEEAFFDGHGFSQSEEHKKEHQKFIDYLEALDLSSIDENQQDTLVDLVKFIAKWIFKHINNSDMVYSHEIRSKAN